jgi:hypothetical protein
VKFLRFWTKRKTFIFADFYFCGLKISPSKKFVCVTEAIKELLSKAIQQKEISWIIEKKTFFINE